MEYSDFYQRYLTRFNEFAEKTLNNLSRGNALIAQAMEYSIKNGGKRIRPVLCYATADMLNVSLDLVDYLAFAVECVHSYSLVHDDLPAMDNDDFRRGKLSTHKKFGEANGILAGDALLNFAFEIVLSKSDLSILDAKALSILAEYAGYRGMINGQALDISNEVNPVDEKLLLDIFENKTSKLLTAPLLMANVFSNTDYSEYLIEYGKHLGILFQITDDILDETGDIKVIGKTPHKDKEANKLTSIKVYGLNGAKEQTKKHFDTCISILSNIPNSQFLIDFTQKIYTRVN